MTVKPFESATTGARHSVDCSGFDGSILPLRPPPSNWVVWIALPYTQARVRVSPHAFADCAKSNQAAKLLSPSDAVFSPFGRYWSNSCSYCGIAGTSVDRNGVVVSLT